MYLIGLDLSLNNTGYSVMNEEKELVEFGNINNNRIKKMGDKLVNIYSVLVELKNKYKPEVVVIENAFTRFNKATQALYRVRGIVEFLFNDTEIIFYSPLTVKKMVTGSGDSEKIVVSEYVSKFFNVVFESLDQSDSAGLLLCFLKDRGINGNSDK